MHRCKDDKQPSTHTVGDDQLGRTSPADDAFYLLCGADIILAQQKRYRASRQGAIGLGGVSLSDLASSLIPVRKPGTACWFYYSSLRHRQHLSPAENAKESAEGTQASVGASLYDVGPCPQAFKTAVDARARERVYEGKEEREC